MEKQMYHFFLKTVHVCTRRPIYVCRDFVSSLQDVFEESGIMIDASLQPKLLTTGDNYVTHQ